MKITAITFALLMSSCSLVPNYQRPSMLVPQNWSGSEQGSPQQIAKDWWASFNSKELDQFMTTALAQNNDLNAGLQRIEQARASLKIAGANLLPTADASAGTSQSRNFDNNRTGRGNDLSAGVGIAYEIDLFGANRAGIKGAKATLAATQFDQESLGLIVMGDVANSYFNILTARTRLAVADKNLQAAKDVQRIIKAQFDAGGASALVVAQQNSAVASAEAARASIVNSQKNAENALAVLMGQAPQTLNVEANNFDGLTIPKIAKGQPSELLERRPDIRATEMDLVAADADIGIARAAYFPKLSLGLNGTISGGDNTSSGLSLLSNLTAPIFQGGRLQGGVEQATARQKELVENYRKTILVSFQEVEDASAATDASYQRETSLNIARQEAQKSYDLSKSLYEAGSIDFQTLLDSQRVLLQAEDSYVQSHLERLSAAVDLYKSLGGGWKE